jgi:GTP-binding protein YchF
MEYMERRLDKIRRVAKGGDRRLQADLAVCERINEALEQGLSARSLVFDEAEQLLLNDLPLLSLKPVLYIANISESDIGAPESASLKIMHEITTAENSEFVAISARIEEEIAMLDEAERSVFLADLGLSESGLDQVIHTGYRLLGLISFLTAGPTEVRAWTIKRGTKAPQAAGKIHSDFEKGFIRAEIVAFADLKAYGTQAAAREKGLVRSEGKEYVMQDGDVVLFRFNV